MAILGAGLVVLAGAGGVQPEDLGAGDARRADYARQLVRETRPPVGSIIAYWGSRETFEHSPESEFWAICDGSAVATEGSPLYGLTMPNMQDRFLMGTSGDGDVRAAPVTGGRNTSPEIKLGSTGGHAITVNQMPEHDHPHRHYMLAREEDDDPKFIDGAGKRSGIAAKGTSGKDSKYNLIVADSTADWGVTNVNSSDAGKGQSHSHKLNPIPAQDNRPAYHGVLYIMRVK